MTTRGAAVLLLAALAAPGSPSRACEIRQQTYIEPASDGERLLMITDRRRLLLLTREGKSLLDVPLGAPAREAALSPSGRAVAVCQEGEGLRLFREGRRKPRVIEKSGDCSSLGWSRDGSVLTYALEAADPRVPVAAKAWRERGGSSAIGTARP